MVALPAPNSASAVDNRQRINKDASHHVVKADLANHAKVSAGRAIILKFKDIPRLHASRLCVVKEAIALPGGARSGGTFSGSERLWCAPALTVPTVGRVARGLPVCEG